jgi:iron(III) transport system substrate-binding protein
MVVFFLRWIAVVAIFVSAVQALAADAASIAAYSGVDREQYLLHGARNEGTLTLYTNIAATDIDKLTAEFERRYGIKTRIWRANPDKVLHRVLSEVRGGRFEVDALHLSTPEMEALMREGLLLPVASPHLEDLRAEAVPPHKAWAASFFSVWVQAYNTSKVARAELPVRYEDLLDRRWKGRLGIEAKNHEWFYTVVKDMGDEAGLRLFRQLAANGLLVRSGTALLNNLVVSGEVPLALTVYNFMVEQAKQKGAPVDWFVIEPAIARGNAVGVPRRSPRPHAAVLFCDFMLGPAQPLLAGLQHVPTSKRVASPLQNVRIKLVDAGMVLDETERSSRLYEEVVLRGPR